MMLITDYRSILFILMFWQTDANLKIVETGTRAGTSSFECGTKLVLTCQIDAYSLSMSWQNDSSSTPLAECIPSTCDLDPNLVGLYEFSPDTSVGIFNLTINKLTLENNGTTYRCGHGVTVESSLVIVKDYEPTLNENTPGIIEVISGCIDNNTEVEYFWEKVKKANLNIESNYQAFQPQNTTNSSNMCLGDNNCEPSHFVKKTCLIGTEPGGEDDYHIRAVLSYDGYVVKSALTTGTYKTDGTTNSSSISTQTTYINTSTTISTDELHTKTSTLTYNDTAIGQINTTVVYSEESKVQTQIIVFIVAGSSVFVIFIVVVPVYIHFVNRKNKSESSKHRTNAEELEMPSEQL